MGSGCPFLPAVRTNSHSTMKRLLLLLVVVNAVIGDSDDEAMVESVDHDSYDWKDSDSTVELDSKDKKILPILAKLQKKYMALNDKERNKLVEKAESYREKFKAVLDKIDGETAKKYDLDFNLVHKILGVDRYEGSDDHDRYESSDRENEHYNLYEERHHDDGDDGEGGTDDILDEYEESHGDYESDHDESRRYGDVRYSYEDQYGYRSSTRDSRSASAYREFSSHNEGRMRGHDYRDEGRMRGHDSRDEDRMRGHDSRDEDRTRGHDSRDEDRTRGHDSRDEDRMRGHDSGYDIFDRWYHSDEDEHQEENEAPPHLDDLEDKPVYVEHEDEMYKMLRDELKTAQMQKIFELMKLMNEESIEIANQNAEASSYDDQIDEADIDFDDAHYEDLSHDEDDDEYMVGESSDLVPHYYDDDHDSIYYQDSLLYSTNNARMGRKASGVPHYMRFRPGHNRQAEENARLRFRNRLSERLNHGLDFEDFYAPLPQLRQKDMRPVHRRHMDFDGHRHNDFDRRRRFDQVAKQRRHNLETVLQRSRARVDRKEQRLGARYLEPIMKDPRRRDLDRHSSHFGALYEPLRGDFAPLEDMHIPNVLYPQVRF